MATTPGRGGAYCKVRAINTPLEMSEADGTLPGFFYVQIIFKTFSCQLSSNIIHL